MVNGVIPSKSSNSESSELQQIIVINVVHWTMSNHIMSYNFALFSLHLTSSSNVMHFSPFCDRPLPFLHCVHLGGRASGCSWDLIEVARAAILESHFNYNIYWTENTKLFFYLWQWIHSQHCLPQLASCLQSEDCRIPWVNNQPTNQLNGLTKLTNQLTDLPANQPCNYPANQVVFKSKRPARCCLR